MLTFTCLPKVNLGFDPIFSNAKTARFFSGNTDYTLLVCLLLLQIENCFASTRRIMHLYLSNINCQPKILVKTFFTHWSDTWELWPISKTKLEDECSLKSRPEMKKFRNDVFSCYIECSEPNSVSGFFFFSFSEPGFIHKNLGILLFPFHLLQLF